MEYYLASDASVQFAVWFFGLFFVGLAVYIFFKLLPYIFVIGCAFLFLAFVFKLMAHDDEIRNKKVGDATETGGYYASYRC